MNSLVHVRSVQRLVRQVWSKALRSGRSLLVVREFKSHIRHPILTTFQMSSDSSHLESYFYADYLLNLEYSVPDNCTIIHEFYGFSLSVYYPKVRESSQLSDVESSDYRSIL